ncbi:hypothetical protein [Sphingobium fuliginis]|jgi:hypothetical protein|uniref:hypothetical protein n=1 Tax=Sphingobium fuliginis (strain ATCC 27551) TaxID=336203 RepID=UPI00046FD195
MPTEIVNLPNFTGYLRFGRDLPVIRFTDRYHPGKIIGPGYVDRIEPAIRLDAPALLITDPEAREEAVAPQPTSEVPTKPGTGSGDADSSPIGPQLRLFGPRQETGASIQQQSRPNGPFRPSTPA